MADQYQEGQELKGSDGKIYVVEGGVPREKVSIPTPTTGVYSLPGSTKQREQQRAEESLRIQQSSEQRQQEGVQRDIEQRTFERGGKLYDQYVGRTAVKMYEAAWPAFTSALSQPDTTQGNRALIYNAIKIFDPEGAVPTGDIEGIESSSPILQRIIRSSGRLLDQGGNLPPEQRKELLDALNQRVSTLRGPYNLVRSDFERRSRNIGIDPLDTIGSPIDQADANIYQEWLKKQQPAAGGEAGPTVTVTPEESIAVFGELGYDKNGNLVGRAYQRAGGTVYDANGNELGLTGTVSEEALAEPAPSFFGGLARNVGDVITGSERATATTEALPDWVEMPELQQLFSIPSFKAALGTAFGGGPKEIAQIVQSNFPGTQVFQDEKGNYILKSPSTGQQYAIKPGFQLSDIPRALNIILSGAGGRGAGVVQTAMREGALQTGIEATQKAVGGTLNPEDIAAAAVIGGGGQKIAEVLPGIVQGVKNIRAGRTAPEMAMEVSPDLPGGITVPGGGVTPPPAPTAAAAPSVAPVAPTGAADEITTAPREATASMMGAGGLSSAPTVGARPLQFNIAPTEILERSTTRAKPGPGILDDASISDRERVLDALGLPPENRRLGAITGNKSQIEDEVMVSKLGEGSERMQQQFDLESRHLGEYALDLVDRTGGTLNLPPVQRGVAIVKPLEDYQNWYNGRIRELYQQADTAAAEAGVPITLQGLDDALKVNSTFGGKAALTTLRKGVRQKLQEMGALGPKGELLPIDTRTAETIRQYLNDQWSPEVSRVIGMLKGKIDDDVLSALPTDVYADARQMRRNYANIFEEPKGIAQLLDISGPEGVNRRIALDVISDKLANLAQKDSAQFNAIVRTLENMPTPELQRAGNQAVAEIRAGILESILKGNVDLEDVAQGGDAMWAGSDKSLSASLTPFKGKLSDIFGPDLAQRLETLRVGARILRFVDPNPSGTATVSQRLVGKTREALIRSGSAMIGGGIGSLASPTGAMIGGAAGERVGAKLVQTAENRARQAAIARSLDPKEKAAQLAKMRKRQQAARQ